MTINEIDSGDADAVKPGFEGIDTDPDLNEYNVMDQDFHAGIASWRLEGEDAGDFQLIETGGRTLIFKESPDYENPADADGDNVYKVTVVVRDNGGGEGRFDVCIDVMNVPEDGKITLLDENGDEVLQPRAKGAITAVLSDPDGSVRDVTWQWATSDNNPIVGTATDIDGETSASHTPDNADTGKFLQVTARYHDILSAQDADDDAKYSVVKLTEHAVLEVEDLKRAPEFMMGGSGISSVTRTVAENSPEGTYVGDPVPAAIDPDTNTTLVYTLDGDGDEDYFALATLPVLNEQGVPVTDNDGDPVTVNTRQIMVKAPLLREKEEDPPEADMWDDVELNYEDEKRNTFTVEITATDPSKLEDTITVTIRVTNRNEAPTAPEAATGPTPPPTTNNEPEFPAETATRTVAQGTAAGANIGTSGCGHGRRRRRHADLLAGRL